MTLLALAPGVSPGYTVQQANTVVNITGLSLATLGSNTGVTFPNSNGVSLLVKTVTGDPGASIVIGATILGESVAPVALVMAVAGNLYEIGPFYSLDQLPGGNLIQVNFATPANVAGLCVLQPAAVP